MTMWDVFPPEDFEWLPVKVPDSGDLEPSAESVMRTASLWFFHRKQRRDTKHTIYMELSGEMIKVRAYSDHLSEIKVRMTYPHYYPVMQPEGEDYAYWYQAIGRIRSYCRERLDTSEHTIYASAGRLSCRYTLEQTQNQIKTIKTLLKDAGRVKEDIEGLVLKDLYCERHNDFRSFTLQSPFGDGKTQHDMLEWADDHFTSEGWKWYKAAREEKARRRQLAVIDERDVMSRGVSPIPQVAASSSPFLSDQDNGNSMDIDLPGDTSDTVNIQADVPDIRRKRTREEAKILSESEEDDDGDYDAGQSSFKHVHKKLKSLALNVDRLGKEDLRKDQELRDALQDLIKLKGDKEEASAEKNRVLGELEDMKEIIRMRDARISQFESQRTAERENMLKKDIQWKDKIEIGRKLQEEAENKLKDAMCEAEKSKVEVDELKQNVESLKQELQDLLARESKYADAIQAIRIGISNVPHSLVKNEK